VRALVVPSLALRGWPRIWVAGCGNGEETWSLAICLQDAGLLSHCRIYATDPDDDCLPRARRGRVAAADLGESEEAYRASGGEGGLGRHLRVDPRGATIDPSLGARIVFSRHDAARDSPFHLFDLVLWRESLAPPVAGVDPRAMRLLDDCCLPGGWLAFRAGEEPEPQAVLRYVRPLPGLPLYRKAPA
jgi:chemotaxis protein methyltransferase CheR